MLLAVAVLLAASPTPIKLASPGLSALNVTPEMQAFVTDHVNQELALEGLDVLSSTQVAAVIGLERQKQLLGCSSDSNCLAEIANALGVDGLVVGTIAKLGEGFQLDLRIAAATDARNLAVFSVSIGNEAGLLDGIRRASAELAAQVSLALRRPLVKIQQAIETRWRPLRKVGFVGFMLSSTAVVGAILPFALSLQFQDGTRAYDNCIGAATGMILGGLIGVVVTLPMWLFGGNEEVPVTAGLVPGHDGFAFALSGRF